MSYGELNKICVSYDKKNLILKDLDLKIEKGELLSLLGPSGCGKTTTLRVIAGLMKASSGTFVLDGDDMTNVPIHKRNFGVVFQSYALFPHLTVRENIAFGLKMRKMGKEGIDEKVVKIAELCGIAEYLERFPANLSGGQRQRVALARALVIEPKILLLDEPLSNLDAQLRIQMRAIIREIQQRLGITTVFVTHDQEECFSISDRVAIMDKGKIMQIGRPEEIYHNPVNEMIAKFVGFSNFYKGDVYKKLGASCDDASDYASRPCDIKIGPAGTYPLSGRITVRTYLGDSYQYQVETESGIFSVVSAQEPPFEATNNVSIGVDESKIVALSF